MIKILVVLLFGIFTMTGLGQRTLVETENHVVTVSKRGEMIVFTMEALNDFTNDRDSSRPVGMGWDFGSIRVDLNNNKVVDKQVDVAFGTRQKTDRFCPQFLIGVDASTPCNGLRSFGKVRVEFTATDRQPTPHAVTTYEIPIGELMRFGGKIGLAFTFYDASARMDYFPTSRNPRSFQETIQLDLSGL